MSKTTKYDLFDNPMVNAAREAMPEEQKKQYEIIGKEMYGAIDFEKSQVLNNMPEPMQQAIIYIEEGLKSGLHPDFLEDDEKRLMEEAYGPQWAKKYINEDDDEMKDIIDKSYKEYCEEIDKRKFFCECECECECECYVNITTSDTQIDIPQLSQIIENNIKTYDLDDSPV